MVESGIVSQTPKELLKQRVRSIDPDFRYYKSLFNATPELIVITDGNNVLDANGAFVRFFSEQGIDVFAPDFMLPNVFLEVHKYGYVYDGYEMRRWYEPIFEKTKEHYRVAITGVQKVQDFNIVVKMLEPTDDIMIVTLTDITELMGYKCALEESFRCSIEHKEEAEALLQQYDRAINVTNLVSKSDLDGTLTYVNDAFCSVLKYEREELLGDNVLIFCVPNEDDVCYENIWNVIESGEIWKGVLENIDRDGEIHHFDTTIIPILDKKGEVIEYLSIRHEITEMVRAKEEAIQMLEAKSKFFDQISHELRTPLNAVVNFTDQALENFDEMFEDEVIRNLVKIYLDRAYKNSQSLLHLINSLLDMAKLQSGKETFAMERYEAVQLVRETFENCSSLHKDANVEYRLNVQTHFVWIECDPFKFRQILTNLISNALKFTKHGFIEIRIYETETECCIDVEDSGSGIEEEKLASIFEPFQQARVHDHGTGLGLNIVREYARAMNFTLDVRSKEGAGSCFSLKAKKIGTEASAGWNI